VPDNFKIQTGLGQLPPDDLQADLYDDMLLLYRAIQNIQRGVSQFCGIDQQDPTAWGSLTYADTLLQGNLTRMYVVASVAISRGQVVNLFNNAGVLNARLARGDSAATMAHGIANNSVGISGILELNWQRGTIDSISGMVVGALYYLSPTVAGAVQTVRPSTAGHIIQPVGLALTGATMALESSLSYIQL